MTKIFMIADTHFGHENIIKYENRPFENSSSMDLELIKKWNNKVGKKDHVFILGDLSFNAKERTKEIVKELHGYKTLILGNHDRRKSITWWKEIGLNEVIKYPIIFNKFYILSHEPIYLNEHMPYINIHGHLHSKKMKGNQYINVGVENTNYEPVEFNKLIKDNINKSETWEHDKN